MRNRWVTSGLRLNPLLQLHVIVTSRGLIRKAKEVSKGAGARRKSPLSSSKMQSQEDCPGQLQLLLQSLEREVRLEASTATAVEEKEAEEGMRRQEQRVTCAH